MLAEITLLQHSRLLLSSPTTAFSATLGALLLGSRIGGLYGQRFRLDRLSSVLRIAALGVSFWLVFAAFVYPTLVDAALPLPLGVRLAATIALTLPLEILLCVLFPNGLRIAHHRDTSGVPIFWGVNAVASTLGGVLALVIAPSAGFQITLMRGAALCFGAGILIHATWKPVFDV